MANGQIDSDLVSAGNAAVLRARFEDAQFFYNEDLKQPLEGFRCAAADAGVCGGGGSGPGEWPRFVFAMITSSSRWRASGERTWSGSTLQR